MGKDLKTAVVVGATGNLGRAVCDALAQRGYHLDPLWLNERHPDAASREAYKALPSPIHLAVYLAGVNVVERMELLTDAQWDHVLDVNLKGAFLFAQAAFPALCAARRSSLITISSIMATHPYPGRTAYAAAKAGLEGLTRALAIEWGPYGIATHCLRLGHLAGLMKSTAANPQLLDEVKRHTPLAKLIEPEEVARYVCWLADGGCHSVSGSVADFDPGYTINRWPLETC